MRVLSCTILLLGLVLVGKATASTFSANEFIQTCLDESISQQTKEKCRGFFYGLVSKKQHLINPPEKDGIVARALTNRTVVGNSTGGKAYRVVDICLPDNITYEDFRNTLSTYLSQSNHSSLDVGRTSDLLALKYSC